MKSIVRRMDRRMELIMTRLTTISKYLLDMSVHVNKIEYRAAMIEQQITHIENQAENITSQSRQIISKLLALKDKRLIVFCKQTLKINEDALKIKTTTACFRQQLQMLAEVLSNINDLLMEIALQVNVIKNQATSTSRQVMVVTNLLAATRLKIKTELESKKVSKRANYSCK